jgi:uncharacterized protein YndB with AHSA1/START domain
MAEGYPDLRYSARPSVEASVSIAASPEVVFAVISDIDLPARFSSEFQGARWLDDADPVTAGSRFVGRNFHPAAGEWETTCTVVEFDPPTTFTYTVEGLDGDASSTWGFAVTPAGSGAVLKQWMQMGPGRSFINLAIESMPEKESRILNRRIREHKTNMEANMVGIKELIESTTG